MLVNADFSRPVVVRPRDHRWVASPQGGVDRMMLDRVGGEQARATSIVRYAPGSRFPPHLHPGGEEILVLSGTFSEEGRDYPAGCYLRSPPGSRHQPSSRDGTLIFVKLRQMRASEHRSVRIDTNDRARWQRQGDRETCPLFADEHERVCLQGLAPGASVLADAVPGAELLVLSGTLLLAGQSCERGSWIRLPAGAYPDFVAGAQGAAFYLKTSALAHTAPEAPA